jgi:ribosome-binding ATPase YchF (GTP1/OBG family)
MMNASEGDLKKLLWLENTTNKVVSICAKLEEDMIGMTETEKKDFLNEMWLKTTGLDDLIKASYDALWLIYYFTAWEKEAKAWTIHKWDKAPKAAGVIHTDFEKWFIKADVVNWKDLVEYGGWSKAREVGKVSLEGKDYVMKDGDVVVFKFNN